jgi:hypothetical protein
MLPMPKPSNLERVLDCNMKKYLIILIVILVACDSSDAPDCLQVAGNREVRLFSVAEFTSIRIEDNINLLIRQGDEIKVSVEAGKNLFEEIKVAVEGNTLVIANDNNCELFRNYEDVIAKVTAPNLTEIRNASIGNVTSEGILNYPVLSLGSNTNGGIDNVKKSGDFIVELNCDLLVAEANGFSRYFVSGNAREARIVFTDELPLFEGANFIVDDLTVFQRSANIMRVNPLNSIRGEIRGTGDVIAVNRPDIVEVDEFFTGRLIFED